MGGRDSTTPRTLAAIAAALALLGTGVLLWLRLVPRAAKVTPAKLPEELVYVRSQDDIVKRGRDVRPAEGDGVVLPAVVE